MQKFGLRENTFNTESMLWFAFTDFMKKYYIFQQISETNIFLIIFLYDNVLRASLLLFRSASGLHIFEPYLDISEFLFRAIYKREKMNYISKHTAVLEQTTMIIAL